MVKRSKIEERISACRQELQAYDYTARKVTYEIAKFIQTLYPDQDFPMLRKYAEIEANAEQRREEIRNLEKQLENAEDDTI